MAKNAKQFEERPWGTFEVLHEFNLSDASDIVIKKITVHPGKRLSYQSHNKRREHWLIVEGQGMVVLDGTELPVVKESKIHVPTKIKHRIINSHPEQHLVLIEISMGEFDENDIKRFEDDFGRA